MGIELKNERIASFSFLCACLVVSVHCGVCPSEINSKWWFNQIFSSGIGAIAVPYFFVVSGFFIAKHVDESGWWKRAVTQRVRTVLIPMFAAALLLTLIQLPLILAANVHAGRPLLSNIGLLNGNAISTLCLDLTHPAFVPLWYLRVLFYFALLSGVFCFLTRRLGLCLLIPGLVFAWSCSTFLPELSSRLNCLFPVGCIFVFSFGMYLKIYNVRVESKFLGWGLLALGVILLSLKIGLLYNGNQAMLIGDFATPLLLSGLWLVLPVIPLFVKLSVYSMPLYILHWGISQYGRVALDPVPLPGFPKAVIWCVLTIVSSLFVAWCFRRCLPRTYALCFGGR